MEIGACVQGRPIKLLLRATAPVPDSLSARRPPPLLGFGFRGWDSLVAGGLEGGPGWPVGPAVEAGETAPMLQCYYGYFSNIQR